MAKWINIKTGDTIEAEGTCYTITRNGNAVTADVAKWCHSAELWIQNDIKAGYYTEFLLEGGN